ncbi:MAG: bile acid:sodium symporter family protein [Candidatus Melainabacteria bacterium]|nr:bile acid:sodium symporter family protein [Candidatus Melainabacteria bacterium]
MLNSLSKFFSQNFFVVITVFAALGLLQAPWQEALKSYIEPMLGSIIFAMALTLHFDDFLNVFKRPRHLALGVAMQYLIMPASAFAIARLLGLPQELAVGLVLVGSSPGGTVSNVLVYIARADLPLSVSMTFVSTCIAPLMLPTMMLVYASHWIEVDAVALFWAAIKIVLIPLAIGLALKALIKTTSQTLEDVVSLVSVLLVSIIIMTMVAIGAPKLAEITNLQEYIVQILIAVFLLNAAGMIFGYYLPKITQPKLELKQIRSISMEVAMQNSGLASVLALAHFGPLAVLPAIFAAIWNCMAGSLLANYWQQK